MNGRTQLLLDLRDRFGITLAPGQGPLKGKVFRVGHLGDTNDLTILGALAGTEMGFTLAGIPHKKGGVQAAMDYLTSQHQAAAQGKAA